MDDLPTFLHDRLTGFLQALQGTDVRELEIEHDSLRVRLHRAGQVVELQASETVQEADVVLPSEPMMGEIIAPLVGTFYLAGKPGMSPLVASGTRVHDSTVVGIIEALQVLTEVEAGCCGTIARVLATDGQPVEYGQVLFEVQLDA